MHEIFSKANSINLFLYLSEVFNFFTFYLHDCAAFLSITIVVISLSFMTMCFIVLKFVDKYFSQF